VAEESQTTQTEVKAAEAENVTVTLRPDPRFKFWTEKLLKALGIKAVATDLPQLLSADMILEIPAESHTKLEPTLLDFLRSFRYAVMDFKGQGDNLNLDKFLLNVARTATFCTKVKPNEDKLNVLNLIVSSRMPEDLLALANKNPDRPEFTNTPERPWLWQGGTFYQNYIIIVCRDLPLEEPYYDWLIFAPSDSDKWKNFAKMMLRENRTEIVEELFRLHPKEMKPMLAEYLKELKQLDPQHGEKLYQDYYDAAEAAASLLEDTWPEHYQEFSSKVVQKAPPEQLISAITSKEVLANLTPEQLEAIRKALAETAPAVQPAKKKKRKKSDN
jgi:hypothetical protein